MNIETIEIPLEEYRMLLREAKKALEFKMKDQFYDIAQTSFEDKLVRLPKLNEYVKNYYSVLDKLNTHEVKFTSEDIPF